MGPWEVPEAAQIIGFEQGRVVVGEQPAVGFIEGDGVGPDVWAAAKVVIDRAVEVAYGGRRRIWWVELPAGERAYELVGQYLPERTLEMIKQLRVAIKGPLTTPVGGGLRSLNVTLRQGLDLYACIRPVRYTPGVPSPLRRPELVDMVVFRENTEDVYAGIEWPAGSPEARRLVEFLVDELGVKLGGDVAVGIKPMSERATKRLVRMAARYVIERGRRVLTLVHKGNIMKYTEGAFCRWGYEVIEQEFGQWFVREGEGGSRAIVNDRIADNMFQQALLRPDEYDVLVTPNLNGDYLSDALAAQVGGLGMAPGANVGEGVAVFEATHGSAPKYAGQDKVNPSSLILSGVMMLEYMGWVEAARLIPPALSETIRAGEVTYDLARQLSGAREVSCSGFAERVAQRIGQGG